MLRFRFSQVRRPIWNLDYRDGWIRCHYQAGEDAEKHQERCLTGFFGPLARLGSCKMIQQLKHIEER